MWTFPSLPDWRTSVKALALELGIHIDASYVVGGRWLGIGLLAEILEGHQSAALCHIGNISWRLGKVASPAEIRAELTKRNVHGNALETLDLTLQHLADNGVDLRKTPLTLGSFLEIDGNKEAFANHTKANQLLIREYRKPFVVPQGM